MAIVGSRPFGADLAKAIGLDVKNLRSFTLEVNTDDAIIVNAVYYVTKENLEDFQEIVKTFTLKPDGN